MVTPMWEHEYRAEAAYRAERLRGAMAPRVPRRAAPRGWSWLRGASARRAAPPAVPPTVPAVPVGPRGLDVGTEPVGLRPA